MSKKNLLPLTLAAGLFLTPLMASADGFRSASVRRASLLDLLASPTRLITEIWNGISGLWQSLRDEHRSGRRWLQYGCRSHD